VLINLTQAAGGIISASLLAVPGASSFHKAGLTVRYELVPESTLLNNLDTY
jgi:nicotinamide mononucleotide (NMN) deamidase PncC